MTEFPTIHRHFPDLQIQCRDINMVFPSTNVNIFQAEFRIPKTIYEWIQDSEIVNDGNVLYQ